MILNLFTFNTFGTFDWLILLALLILPLVQVVAIWQKKTSSTSRIWLKTGLNLLLWLTVCLFFINPTIEKSIDSNKILLVSDNIPQQAIQTVKDSLKITEVFSQKAFNRQVIDNPQLISQLGKIYLFGEDATPELLSKLNQKSIYWIPYFQPDELQEIHWKGVLNKGEIQQIDGKINSSKAQMLRLKYGNQVIDSLKLSKGFNGFELRFTNFSIGKTALVLALQEKSLQEVNFFSLKNQPKHFQFILSNPDFESKTLADWLGKNGNQVETITTVAKNTQSTFSINAAKKFVPDIIITDPSNAGNSLVKKAFAEGKSILFINVEEPDVAIKSINQHLGTKWKVRRTSTQENLVISQDLTAHPYQFEPVAFQKVVFEYPIAIQKHYGKVGISLLNESFPLILSGDSITYTKIWQSTFQALNPSSDNVIRIDAPLYPDVVENLKTIQNTENRTIVAKDTAFSTQSGINPLSAEAKYVFRKTGWNIFQDSLAVYVEENQNDIANAKSIKPYLKESIDSTGNTAQSISTSLPEWLWYVLIVLLLTALWLEPKL